MGTTEIDIPDWFDSQYVSEKFDTDIDGDAINDLYGFADGLLDNKAPDDGQELKEYLEQAENQDGDNYFELVGEFAGEVTHDDLRYDFKGVSGAPDHLGKKLGGHRKSTSNSNLGSQNTTADKNPNPQKSEFKSGRDINLDRLEEQGELDESVHHDIRKYDEDQVELILDGKIDEVGPKTITFDEGYQDLSLSELEDHYDDDDTFNDHIDALDEGIIVSDGDDLNSVSIISYKM